MPVPIGAIMSGIGGIASAFGGKSRTTGSDIQKSVYQRDLSMYNYTKKIREWAKQAGVSPLTLMGANVMQPPTFRTEGANLQGLGAGLSQMGQSIAQLPQIKASIEESKARTELARSQAAAIRRSPESPNPTPQNSKQAESVTTLPKQRTSTRPGTPSLESGSQAELQVIDTPTGKKVLESEKAGEVYEQQGELATAARFAKKLFERGELYVRNRFAPRHYQVIRNHRPKSNNPKYEWRYSPMHGEYRKARIGSEGPQTFWNKKLWKSPSKHYRRYR